MGRPLTGKKHVGIRRDTRPNGDVYVYERVTGYDAKTQKTKTISTRLLGKILAGTTEMIPTRPKKSRSEVEALKSSKAPTNYFTPNILRKSWSRLVVSVVHLDALAFPVAAT